MKFSTSTRPQGRGLLGCDMVANASRPHVAPTGKVSCAQRCLQFAYAVSNVANAALGSGVLAFPLAFSLLGWVNGIAVTIVAAALNGYMLTVVVRCARYTGSSSYAEMCALMFGRWAGRVVLFSAGLFCYSCMLSYLLVFGDMLSGTIHDFFPSTVCALWADPYVVSAVVWLLIQPLCFVRSIDFLGPAAIVGVVAVVFTVAMLVWHAGTSPHKPPFAALKKFKWEPSAFQAVPIILFAYMCHMTVVPATSNLGHYWPSQKPSTSSPSVSMKRKPRPVSPLSSSADGGGVVAPARPMGDSLAGDYFELPADAKAQRSACIQSQSRHTRGGGGADAEQGEGDDDDAASYAYSFGPEDGRQLSASSQFIDDAMTAEARAAAGGAGDKPRWWSWKDNLSLGRDGPGGSRSMNGPTAENPSAPWATPPMTPGQREQSLTRYRTLVLVCACVMAICAAMYIPTGLAGYILFGENVDGDVMLSFGAPPSGGQTGVQPVSVDVKIGRLCMALTVVLGFPTVVFIGRDAVVDALGLVTRARFASPLWLLITAAFSFSSLLISMLLRLANLDIGFVLSFIGSTSGVLIQFGMPALMLIRLGSPIQGYAMVVITTCVMVIGLSLTFASAICPLIAKHSGDGMNGPLCVAVGYGGVDVHAAHNATHRVCP